MSVSFWRCADVLRRPHRRPRAVFQRIRFAGTAPSVLMSTLLLDARSYAGEYFKCCPCMGPCCFFFVYATITPLNQDVFQFHVFGLNVCCAWPQCGCGNLTRIPETNTFSDVCNTVTLVSENKISIGGVTFDKKMPTNNARAMQPGMQPEISAPPMQSMNRVAPA